MLTEALETVLLQRDHKSIGVVHDGIFIFDFRTTAIREFTVLLVMR